MLRPSRARAPPFFPMRMRAYPQRFTAFAALERSSASSGSADWKDAAQPYVAVGTYSDRHAAEVMAARLRTFGSTSIEIADASFSVTLSVGAGGAALDRALEASWQAGATDAMIVRE